MNHRDDEPYNEKMNLALPTIATPQLRISSQFIPPAVVEAALELYSNHFDDEPASPANRGEWEETVVTLLESGCDRASVAQALSGFYTHVVELDDAGDTGSLWLGVPGSGQSFYLSLTTTTAYSLQPSVLVCEALLERGVVPASRRAHIELCLHEAVANGLIHGNLGVDSGWKDGPDGYRIFNQMISERLHHPQTSRRRLDCFVRWTDTMVFVSVCDDGDGFDVAVIPDEADRNARSGRGFMFMRALSDGVDIGAGERCITLRFQRN
jgi:anti-sigma regulatory factor (Ser/Thr protein kinase)